MPTYQEIVDRLNQEELRIFQECFALKEEAKKRDIGMDATVQNQLSEGDLKNLRARIGEEWAYNRRTELAQEHELVMEEYGRALFARREEIEDALFGPAREADARTVLEYTKATEEQLSKAFNAAILTDNMEALLLVLVGAYANDYDVLLAKFMEIEEGEIASLFMELQAIDGLPDYDDPGSRFEELAAASPTREQLLMA